MIVGVDSEDPTRELERTEFVRVSNQHALIRRIVQAAEIDTVVDTRLVVDSRHDSARLAHENNVIGTLNILAACSGPDSPVRKLVFKSSAHYYGCEPRRPRLLHRGHAKRRTRRATPIERDIVEAEAAVADFRDKNPDVDVTRDAFLQRARTGHADLARAAVLAARRADDARASTRATSSFTPTTSSRALEFAVENDIPASTTRPPTACLP